MLLITLFSIFVYPNRTYLQSDTQIYVPVLEWMEDPGLYQDDLIPRGAHISYTLYDETTRALRYVTGSVQSALEWQQFVFRACGVWGVYLIATAVGLGIGPALATSLLVSLGATIVGPAVLTVEYEPVPRGFAIGLFLLSAGMLAHRRYWPAAIAGGMAFAFHAPAVWPFWLLVPLFGRRREMLIGLAATAALIAVLSVPQTDIAERQRLFTVLSDDHARLQQLRASYNWISIWFGRHFWFYLTAWLVSLVAYWRVKNSLSPTLRILFLGMPILGMLTMPVSYVLLEKMRWALLPQLQPMRALLFVVLFAAILAAIAAWKTKNLAERAAWLALVTMVPFLHGGQAPRKVETPELRELADWARKSTARDAVFLFPDEGRALPPGIFRARALRTVYVDWKSGGQVNYFPGYAEVWWQRWTEALVPPFEPGRTGTLSEMGIDYLVLSTSALPHRSPVWKNERYAVYSIYQ